MTIPGFFAESSLDRARRRYFMVSRPAASGPSQAVIPQLPKSIGFCMDDCDTQYEWGSLDNAYCKSQCSGDDGGTGGDGGSGGGASPLVHCGSCIKLGPHKGQKLCAVGNGRSYYTAC